MRRARTRLAALGLLVMFLAGCDFWVYQVEPTPTPAPPPPPGSACAVLPPGRLQSWLEEKLPRSEKEVPGGVVYFDTPRVTNCIENTAYVQVRVGYQRDNLVIELGLTEFSFDLRYDGEQGQVCLDLVGALSAPEMAPQGVEQVGESIQVSETRAGINASSLDAMPAATRQQFDAAVSAKVGIAGTESQGIGNEAAGILLDWAVGDLLERLSVEFAKLIGACIAVP